MHKRHDMFSLYGIDEEYIINADETDKSCACSNFEYMLCLIKIRVQFVEPNGAVT